MKRPRTTTYLALLLSLSLTAGAVTAVGDTHARTEGIDTIRNTVLLPRPGALRSDCLVSEGKQTILLGELESGEDAFAEITLEAREDFSGPLLWQTTEGAPVQTRVDFNLIEGEGSLNAEHLLQMRQGAKAIVTLTVTAAEELPAAGIADVELTCGALGGIFRVELLADAPEASEPEEPTEATEPEQGGGVDVILPGEDGSPIQITPNGANVELKTLTEFEITSQLPIKATVSGEADRLVIGLEGGNALPSKTRYSTDGGESWYMLYDGGYIELEDGPEGGAEVQWTLLADVSVTDLEPEEPLFLEAQAYSGDVVTGLCSAETVPREPAEQPEVIRILRSPGPEDQAALTALLGLETESQEPAAEEPAVSEETEPTEAAEPESGVTEGYYFRVPLPLGWAECGEIRYQAEILTKNEAGGVEYAPVQWDQQYLNAVMDPETGDVIVYMGAQPPTAGTYRLTLECIYEDICFHRMQTTFFINYSTRSDAQQEEVPDNE